VIQLSHLQKLEAEAIGIIREVAATFREAGDALFRIGKDSACCCICAMKAFAPGKPPFPLLHVDTTVEVPRDDRLPRPWRSRLGFDLLVHINEDGVRDGINPFASGSALHTAGDEDGRAEAGARQIRLRCGLRRRAAR
jgi:sulfate adenylyltransferase subunit 2